MAAGDRPTYRIGVGHLALGLAVLIAWCGWVSGFHRATAAAVVTWAISVAVVVTTDVVALRLGRAGRLDGLLARRHRWPLSGQARGATAVALCPWLALVVIVVCWDALGLATGAHAAHLTASALAQSFRSFNAALELLWIGVGLWFGIAASRVPSPDKGDGTCPAAGAALFAVTHHPLALLLPDDRAAGIAFFIGVVAMGVVLQLFAWHSHGRIPTVGEAFDALSAPIGGRLALMAIWGYGGWHLFAS